MAMRSIVQCNSGEGFRTIDGPEPLTPTLSHKGRGGALPMLLQINPISPNAGKPA